MLLSDILEKQAYSEANGGDEMPEEGVSTTDHYTREVKAWKEISFLNLVVWAPTFSAGLLGLSELLMP